MEDHLSMAERLYIRKPRSWPALRTPIPEAARPIIAAVHRRYRVACQRGERPAIHDPRRHPLKPSERCRLAEMGYYPIPAEVIQLGMTPDEHRQRQLLAALLADLPALQSRLLNQESTNGHRKNGQAPRSLS